MRHAFSLLVAATLVATPVLADAAVISRTRSSGSSQRPALRTKIMQTKRLTQKQAAVRTKIPVGTYGAFTPAVLNDGRTKVLFFYAAWCPACQKSDAKLKEWYEPGKGLPMSVYQINFDTAADLKQTYGVIHQDTFVLVDGTGKMLKSWISPSQTDLRQALSAQ